MNTKAWSQYLFLYLNTIFFTFFFSSCLFPKVEKDFYLVANTPLAKKTVDWKKRCLQLESLQAFIIKGHLEVHAHGHKGGDLSFEWRQKKHYYQLKLFDPLGRLYFNLTVTKKGVKLFFNQKTYMAKHPEPLIQQHLGIILPIHHFTYWLRSMPVPTMRHQRVLTDSKHLLKLHQDGWFIRYLRYHEIGHFDLPTQLLMLKSNWYARILITHWKLSTDLP